MNENQYRKLCTACDQILLAKDSTIDRVAIPWLHIIREHPVFLRNYVDLFCSPNIIAATVRRWLRLLRNIGAWIRQTGRILDSTGKYWFATKQLPAKVDVLFVSHLLNSKHAGQPDDFYFGSLPAELSAQGHLAVVALVNYTGEEGGTLITRWRENSVPRVIFSLALGAVREGWILRRLISEALRLSRLARVETDGFVSGVIARASQEALSSGAQSALRIGAQVTALVAELRPRVILVTYEGHAWERVAFASARAVIPDIKCIAYQHAALFRLQHAARRLLSGEYNPDYILTAGKVSKRQLQTEDRLAGIPIAVLGSNRSTNVAAVSRECVAARRIDANTGAATCLVLPEGIIGECQLLFEFSLTCAHALPQVRFIWRLHPLMSFKTLITNNRNFRSLPSNIELSSATLESDLARSRWSLYRGSTAVIAAVVSGLRPIYLQLQHELTVDPLYELEVFREKVACVSEFAAVVNSDLSASSTYEEEDFAVAQSYCDSFFMPLDANVLISLVART